MGGTDGVTPLSAASVMVAPPPHAPAVSDSFRVASNVISLAHWQRLRDGALLATSTYVDWASLLQRTFEVDVLRCAQCGGRLRILAVVTDTQAIRRILGHLGVAPDPLPLPRARDPDDEVASRADADGG